MARADQSIRSHRGPNLTTGESQADSRMPNPGEAPKLGHSPCLGEATQRAPESKDTPTAVPDRSRTATGVRRQFTPLAIGLLLFAAAVILPLFRQTGARSWQTIWAEDGFEYFEQARRYGGLAVIFRGYGGYLQLPPRLLAGVAALIPIHDVSIYLALSSTFVGALLAWFTFHVSEGWIPSTAVRLALASLVVVMPALGTENTANVTNTIWIFAAVAPWALVSLAERPLDIFLRSIVAFLAATSTSLCFLFLPLVVGFVLIRRTRAARIAAAAFGAGLTIQVAVVLHTKDVVSYIPHSFLSVQRSFSGITSVTGVKVFATFLIGTKGTSTPWLNRHQFLAIGSIVCFSLILLLLLVGAARKNQVLAVVFASYAVVCFVVPAWSRQEAPSRYSVIPVMMLASAVAVLVADTSRRRNLWVTRIGRPLFVAQILLLTIIGFSVTTYRSENLQWSNSVTSTSHTRCDGASPNKLVEVPTDQQNYWPVTLPCRDLRP
jgi:hypothetical protein